MTKTPLEIEAERILQERWIQVHNTNAGTPRSEKAEARAAKWAKHKVRRHRKEEEWQ